MKAFRISDTKFEMPMQLKLNATEPKEFIGVQPMSTPSESSGLIHNQIYRFAVQEGYDLNADSKIMIDKIGRWDMFRHAFVTSQGECIRMPVDFEAAPNESCDELKPSKEEIRHDLLAACEAVLNDENCTGAFGLSSKVTDQLEAAIAKAKS